MNSFIENSDALRVLPLQSIVRQPVFFVPGQKADHIHTHPHWEVGCILEGKINIELENGLVPAGRGDCFVYSPGTKHTERYPSSPTPIIAFIGIESKLITGCTEGLTLFKDNPSTNYRALFTSVIAEMSQQQVGWEEILNTEVKKLLIYFTRKEVTTASSSDFVRNQWKQELVEQWQKWAELHCIEPDFRIAPHGTVGPMSIRHFETLFREVTGTTCKMWVDRYRMEKAQQLLRAHQTPIHEIAESCGYKNLYHFTRRFSQLVGVSPAKYRINSIK